MMLDQILASTRRRVEEVRASADEIAREAEATGVPPSFARALSGDGLAVIAEVKRRSPSQGPLDASLDPVAQAQRYAAGGAAAVSVLTEPDFFDGSPADLMAVAGHGITTIRKDFIIDPVQIYEARAWGASAVLLIVAALTTKELGQLIDKANGLRLTAVVEVHDAEEARQAVDSGASVVGVNNRDLGDFTVDLATSERLAPLLESVPLTVAESGIFTPADAARMAEAGYDAILVGEALVKSADPATLVRQLREASLA